MEPNQLQLLLNIVTITGIASLAGYCYLLKKENRRLAAHKEVPKAEVAQAVFHLPSREPAATPVTTPVTTSVTAPEDIRNFAAGRRTRWVKGLASSIS